MANPKSSAVVATALSLLDVQPPIPYVSAGETLQGMDCQGLVEYCVRENGGRISFAGSNDMFRNACGWLGTLAEARAQGKLLPGTALFILKQDGGEPAKYTPDGLGNASHVGLYCGDAKAEVVHASSSRGCVAASTLKNAWTHVGLLKAVDYGTAAGAPDRPAPKVSYATTWAASGTTVNMRSTPKIADDNYMLKIPIGTRLPVHAYQAGWTHTEYNGFIGWVKDEYLRFEDAATGSSDAGDAIPRAGVERIYQALGALLGGQS